MQNLWKFTYFIPIIVLSSLFSFTDALKCMTCDDDDGHCEGDFDTPPSGSLQECSSGAVRFCVLKWNYAFDSPPPPNDKLVHFVERRCDNAREGRIVGCVDNTEMRRGRKDGQQFCFCKGDGCNNCDYFEDCQRRMSGDQEGSGSGSGGGGSYGGRSMDGGGSGGGGGFGRSVLDISGDDDKTDEEKALDKILKDAPIGGSNHVYSTKTLIFGALFGVLWNFL